MKRTSLFLGMIVSLVLISACKIDSTAIHFMKSQKDRGRDFHHNPKIVFQDTTLKRIVENPRPFVNTFVSFEAIMNRHDGNVYEAYYSSMSDSEYYNFSIYPTNTALWTKEGWAQNIDTMYFRKESPYFNQVFDLERFDVIRVSGMVVSDFNNVPWIEAYYVDKVDSKVYDEAALAGLVRGLNEHEKKNNALAIKHLEQGVAGTLPDNARFRAHYLLGVLYFDRARVSKTLADHEAAILHFESALDYDGDSREAGARLESAQSGYEQRKQILEREREEREKRERARAEKRERLKREEEDRRRKAADASRKAGSTNKKK